MLAPKKKKKQCHCPSVTDMLLKSYMEIFPLWSSLPLGDLSQHMKSETIRSDGKLKTRDTNCHAELWFGLVKHCILQKKRYLQQAEFVFKTCFNAGTLYRAQHATESSTADFGQSQFKYRPIMTQLNTGTRELAL